MDTTKIIEEMKQIKDLRTKQALELKNKFLKLIEEYKKILDESRYRKYLMIVLKYYDYSKDCSNNGDERLALYYEDGDIKLVNQEFVYENGGIEAYWKEQGNYFKEDVEKGLDGITTTKAFQKIDKLIESIKELIEDEKKYLEKQAYKIEKANNFLKELR